jgi:hypothetical protein
VVHEHVRIDVGAPPLPKQETRLEFMQRYVEHSGKRLTVLESKDEAWWESDAKFFDTKKPRTWIMVRRIAHTSHHRGQLMAIRTFFCCNVTPRYLHHSS